MKYQYLIFVIPATRHKASSGMAGIMNKIGKNNLLFVSKVFCMSSNSFLPINFLANNSPNLSPMKNKIVEEKNIEIMQEKKASFEPNKIIPNMIKVVFSIGMKQNIINKSVCINVYTKKLYFEFCITFCSVSMVAILQAFNITNRIMDTIANESIIKVSFNHLFIMPLYDEVLNVDNQKIVILNHFRK